jgi:hypothetical protein
MSLYHCEEWQGASGYWYCEHTSSFPRNVQKWVVPARILEMTPADFLKFLMENFKPDKIIHNEDYSFVGWGWNSQAQMRKYKNFINQKARERGFQL